MLIIVVYYTRIKAKEIMIIIKPKGYYESDGANKCVDELFKTKKIVGVYMLYRGSDVVYVGKSIDVIRRVYNHKCTKKRTHKDKRPFDYAIAYEFKSRHDIEYVEPYLIGLHKPELNREFINESRPSITINWRKSVINKYKIDFNYDKTTPITCL